MVKAIVFHEYGGPEVLKWEDVEVGDPGPDEVRICHTAVGLNYRDVYYRNGNYGVAEFPAIIGVANVREILEGQTYFRIEGDRVRNVVLKLARGHAHYELSDPKLEEPITVDFAPLVNFSARDREGFEYVNPPHLFPEVGSRALQRVVASGMTEWIVVQPDRYRYLAIPGDKVEVRMVLSEYKEEK